MRHIPALFAAATFLVGSSTLLKAADSLELRLYRICIMSIAASLSEKGDTVDLMLFDSLDMRAAEMKRISERAEECRDERDLAAISLIEKSPFFSRATTSDKGKFSRYLEAHMIASILFEAE